MLTDEISDQLNDFFQKRWWGEFAQGEMPTIAPEASGAMAVYRVMMGVFAFHTILACCLCGVRSTADARAKLQNELWCVKLPLLVGLIVAMFFVPGQIVLAVAEGFKAGGFIFILIQLVFLTAFSYDVYEDLLTWAEDEETRKQGAETCCDRIIWWNLVTVVLTLGCYGFCIFTFAAIVIVNSKHDEGCWLGIMAGLVNMVCMLIVSGLSVSNWVRDASNGAGYRNGIFQSGVVSAYACWLVFSAMINSPEPGKDWNMQCHVYNIHNSGLTKMSGMVFVFIAVLWTAIRNGSNTFFTPANTGDAEAPLLAPAVDENGETGEKADDETEEAGGVTYSYSQFHIVFALAASYSAMLLTRWGDIDSDGTPDEINMQDSKLSVWLKVVSSWLCFLIYTWAMVAPPLFPDRDFSS